jgi:hypothetical protein
VETETTVPRMVVQDPQVAITQLRKDGTTAENTDQTTRMSETTFEEMLNTIWASLNDLASSDNEQDGEDEEDDDVDTQLS